MRSFQRAGIAVAVMAVMALPSPVVAAVGDWQLVGAAPAGDLDGDGRDDVLVFKQIETDAAGSTYVEVEAHRGHDGVELWSIDLPGIPEVVPDGAGGVFLASYDGVFSGGVQSASAGEHPAGPFCCTGIGQLEMTLRRLSGDGTITFERTFGGSYAYTGTNVRVADELTMVTGSLDTTKGTEVLVATYRRTPGADEPADEVEITTIDRAGEESAVATQALAGALTTVTPTDDLDGDGSQDVLLQVDRPNADGELLAFRTGGDNAAPLWTATTASDWRYPPAPLGDVDGDGVGDVAIDANGPYHGDYTTQTVNESVAVVSGATGAVRKVQGGDVRGVGDVNGDGAAELLTVARYQLYDELLVETHLLDGASLRHLTARDLVGTVEPGTQHQVTVRSMGDLNGDGNEDIDVRTGTPSGPVSGVTLSGRDLSALEVPAGGLPLRASADGDGDDVYVTNPEGERDARLSLRDGRTSAERWSTVIAAAGPSQVRLDVQAVNATAAHRADLLVRSSSAGCQAVIGGVRTYGCRDYGQIAVYDGASGALRWRVVSRP